MGKVSRSRHNNGSSSSTSTVPWKDMFRSASFRMPKHDPFSPRGESSAGTSGLKSQRRIQHCNSEITSGGRILSMDRNPRSDPNLSGATSASSTVPWQEMVRSASFRRPADFSPRDRNGIIVTRENNHAQPQQNRPRTTAAITRENNSHARPQQNNPDTAAVTTSGETNLVQPQQNNPRSTSSLMRVDSIQIRPDPRFTDASRVMSLEGRDISPRDETVDRAPDTIQAEQIGGGSSSLMENNLNLNLGSQNQDEIQLDDQALSEEDNITANSPRIISQNNDVMLPNIKLVTFPKDPHLRMALYVTMAQAILAILLVLFYGGLKLLEEYLRPILWAAFCSIPIRGIQDTLVEFWSEPLRLGLIETVLAIPVAVLKVLVGTVVDAQEVYDWIFHGKELVLSGQVPHGHGTTSGFLKLFRRLVSFGFFVFAYEQIGSFGIFTLLGVGFMFSTSSLYQTTVSTISSLRSDSFRLRTAETNVDQSRVGILVAHWILSRLKTILAVALILGMMFAFLAGAIFFSYKIGVEAKDAVVSLKSHLEESNFEDQKLGIKRWIEEHEVMETVEWYTNECHETLWQQVDILSARYNITEFMKLVKHLVISPPNSSTNPHQYPVNFSGLRNLKSVMKELLVTKEEMFEKAKCLATQGIDEFLHALGSSRFILDGFLNLVLSIGQSMVYGAAGLLNIVLQVMVFFWVLYYLLTSESGGVTEQVMKMIPISKPAKKRCIDALNNAVSGVLVATAEIAFFQGCFTWLLCRLYSIHFVYMSTMLAFISPLLPIFPPWVPALPAALQLILDSRYVMAASFCVTHLVLMDYGASEIAEDVPGYSAYLTGVSIIGGMTLFPSALEVIYIILVS